MKKLLNAAILVITITLLTVSTSAAQAPHPTVTLLNALPTQLDVGESYTVDVLVTSDEPFVLALALCDAYYPGRGVYSQDSDRATHATSATLHLTFTGKGSTADLPGGAVPLAVVVGVRYKGGAIVAERFDFAVAVP